MIFRASWIFYLRGRVGFGRVASFDEARWTGTPPAKTEQVGGGDGDKPSVPIRSPARRRLTSNVRVINFGVLSGRVVDPFKKFRQTGSLPVAEGRLGRVSFRLGVSSPFPTRFYPGFDFVPERSATRTSRSWRRWGLGSLILVRHVSVGGCPAAPELGVRSEIEELPGMP